MEHRRLTPAELFHGCDPANLPFETTADLEDLDGFVGQPRVVEALRFGVGMKLEGYNIYALGRSGTGKYSLVRRFLDELAPEQGVPDDCCYVNNFDESHKPRLLRIPAGEGKKLSQDMEKLIEDARNALRAAFENEEYQNRVQATAQEFQERQQNLFEDLRKKSEERGLTLIKTPAGFAFAPVKEGEVVPPEEFNKLPEDERKKIEKDIQELQQEAQKALQKLPAWERERWEKMKELRREVSSFAVNPLLEELRKKYQDLSNVVDYLDKVEKDIVENVQAFLPQQQQQQQQQLLGGGMAAQAEEESKELRRYRVNVLVDHSESKGAPVVYEDNPTYNNLTGRTEHLAHMGTLLTDFSMIRPGALHRANGGYLLLDALKVLSQPFAWEALKRALRSRRVRIESLGEQYGVLSTVSLEPEPVPLDVKVILLGSPLVYYLLGYYDPDFNELFKVAADFDTQMNRTEENQDKYARFIGTVSRQENLRHFDRGAVARAIEQGARMVGDGERLSIHIRSVSDLLRESDYWAGQNGKDTVTADDVQKAVDAWTYRSDRMRERLQEEIQRGTIFIDTTDDRIGQVNGLSVIQMGDFPFGRPNRITAKVRLGKGEVVDIEREVAMGGPIHSKGVLILSSFLGARYAMDTPLSLSASLVFEQSYGGIEGDSASSAELYALLSAIGRIPIKQCLAVTGSVDQHGRVQPIGGVNEKIEGFFDTCKARGLTGEQGVLIPAANTKHLMLRNEVIQSVEDGQFHVYPVETIDEGMEILTGMQAGEADEKGEYPEDSVNAMVQANLAAFAEKRKSYAASIASEHEDKS